MRWHSNSQLKPYLLLLPALVAVFSLTCYGLWLAVLESFDAAGAPGIFHHYQVLLSNQTFLTSIVFSCYVALCSTLLSLILGLSLTKVLDTYLLSKKWDVLIWLPMVVPHFVAAYLIFILFSSSGWFSGLAYHLNLIQDPAQFPILINDRAGFGVILTYVWKEVPFVILMLLPVFQQLNPQYRDAVRTLGGSSWQIFLSAEWPWLFPVMLESGIILFSFLLAGFEVPYLLGVTQPKMIPVLVYQWFYEGSWELQPRAMAAIVLTSLLILIVAVVYFRLSQRVRLRIMKGR